MKVLWKKRIVKRKHCDDGRNPTSTKILETFSNKMVYSDHNDVGDDDDDDDDDKSFMIIMFVI